MGATLKKFVLDTNVILDNASILKKTNLIKIIPIEVVIEVDNHKKSNGELGANARLAAKILDELSASKKKLNTFQIYSNAAAIDSCLSKHKLDASLFDNRILATAIINKAILMTNDVALRVKARALKVECEILADDNKPNSISEIYNGYIELKASEEEINNLYAYGEINTKAKLLINQYVLLTSVASPAHTAIARWDGTKLVKVQNKKTVFGVKPRNLEQTIALDALLDNKFELVTMLGKAGTGKTLLALAAALELTLEERLFDKIILMRSPIPVGRDIGWLPGDIMSKIMPFFQGYIDNFENILANKKDGPNHAASIIDNLLSSGKLEFTPPTYMRGRSIARSIIIVDEAQNMSKHEIKTIATRLGENSKLIVMGDVHQIDNKFDALDNGFIHLVESFKDEKCAAHIELVKCERSKFADIAALKL